MSQNRGYRRDGGRQSYGMNSNYGGRGGHGGGVNPWEGGMVPGRSQGGLSGLLPTPTQSNLMSQLTSPEAQLALASNLLSSLLQPQQPQVPSLLSLGGLGNIGNNAGFRQQSNYGDRYNDMGPVRRNKRMDGRRLEPYKGRSSAPSKGGSSRKPGNQNRSPLGKSRPTSGSKKADKKDEKDSKEKDVSEEKDNAEKKADAEEDVKRDEEGDDDEGKKRDWKDEKKGDDDTGTKGDAGSEDDDGDDKDGKEKGLYAGIPKNLFNCHVCNKHMWNGGSFENHLKGRTHQLMMQKLEESYKIRVELMRHELKVAEQQREIEMGRMKRQGRRINLGTQENFCTMCDLQFFGNLFIHRKSTHHQQLKNFLHPRCSSCSKEFPTRIEWDHHRLTPMHLRKMAESRKNKITGSDDEFDEFMTNDSEKQQSDIEVRTREDEEDEIKEADKTREENGDKTESEGKAGEGEQSEDTAKTDGDSKDATVIGSYRIEKYNPEISVGQSLLKKVSGHTCRGCQRFFLTEEDALTHCRTLSHYNNYLELVKAKARAREERERLAAEKKARELEESSKPKEKRANEDENPEDDGNWKRRKVSSPESEDKTQIETEKVEEEESNDNSQIGGEKYDPLEADAEDDAPDKDAKLAVKKEDEESMWAEVDKDLGSLIETIGVEAEAEAEAEPEEVKQESAKSPKPSTRTRGGSPRATASPAPATRGRAKRKK